jgi:hypothetical protein
MEVSQARPYGAVNLKYEDLAEIQALSKKIEKKDAIKLSNRAVIMKAVKELAKKY